MTISCYDYLLCHGRISLKTLELSFYHAMHYSAKHSLAIACRLSVHLSVCDGGS